MKSSTTIDLKTGISVLLVGEPKSGKTSVMLSFPDLAVIDWDLNLASGMRRSVGKTFTVSTPPQRDDGSPRPMPEQWMAMVNDVKTLVADPKIKTIAIDGLSNMANALCAHITNSAATAGASKVKTLDESGRWLAPAMEIQHYGDLARLLRGLVMMIRSSGKSLIVTSHQSGDKDEVTKAIRYVVAIPGQMKDTIGGCFTDVWAVMCTPLGVGKVKYEIMTKPTGFHVALGASFPIAGAIDITDKTSQQIGEILAKSLS